MTMRNRLRRAINRVIGPLDLQISRLSDLDALSEVDAARRLAVTAVMRATQGTVANGPFAGMQLLMDLTSWGDGDLGSKLLGCYEEQLSEYIEQAVGQEPNCIINLGCAEGYYAVGMALRLPKARVIAVDTDQAALEAVAANASLNGVDARIETVPSLDDSELHSCSGSSLWIVDIEGSEMELVDPRLFPSLLNATVIMELHEFIHPHLEQVVARRFSATHNILMVSASGRNPYLLKALQPLPDHARWLVVSEGRPEEMRWAILTPRVNTPL
jgi:hypothetical protein